MVSFRLELEINTHKMKEYVISGQEEMQKEKKREHPSCPPSVLFSAGCALCSGINHKCDVSMSQVLSETQTDREEDGLRKSQRIRSLTLPPAHRIT